MATIPEIVALIGHAQERIVVTRGMLAASAEMLEDNVSPMIYSSMERCAAIVRDIRAIAGDAAPYGLDTPAAIIAGSEDELLAATASAREAKERLRAVAAQYDNAWEILDEYKAIVLSGSGG